MQRGGIEMDLFEKLRAKRLYNPFNMSEEMRYYLENVSKLSGFDAFKPLVKASRSFDVIRANVILRGLSNKETLESAYRKAIRKEGGQQDPSVVKAMYESELAKLPYYEADGERIWMPFFPRSLNSVYGGDPAKLEDHPYKMLLRNYRYATVDPFDYYGPDLFDSLFTKLIKVASHKGNRAYFDYDSYEVYFVNEQGRLDADLVLFDRYIGRPSYNHMLDRIEGAVEAYYKDDKKAFIKSLVDNKLISSSLIYKITYDENEFNEQLDRKFGK